MISRSFTLLLTILMSLSIQAYKLTAFIPQENPTGTGVIVCPGGSYCWLDKKGEGYDVAQWLRDNGIAAFVLEYSHAGWASFAFHFHMESRTFPAGFNDLCNAFNSVRSHAAEYGVRPDRIGCMGFSAGGHLVMHGAEQLAGTSSSMFFVAPLYPVVSMTHPTTHRRSRRGLLGEFPSQELKDSLSLEHHVPAQCPPVFLMNCDDDPVVDSHNAEMLDSALTVKNIPHQYEHYRTGGHGFGVSPKKTTAEAIQWKDRFLAWLHKLILAHE
jgi:acetyl esterase/lipase